MQWHDFLVIAVAFITATNIPTVTATIISTVTATIIPTVTATCTYASVTAGTLVRHPCRRRAGLLAMWRVAVRTVMAHAVRTNMSKVGLAPSTICAPHLSTRAMSLPVPKGAGARGQRYIWWGYYKISCSFVVVSGYIIAFLLSADRPASSESHLNQVMLTQLRQNPIESTIAPARHGPMM